MLFFYTPLKYLFYKCCTYNTYYALYIHIHIYTIFFEINEKRNDLNMGTYLNYYQIVHYL
jgi:hypothetical protein